MDVTVCVICKDDYGELAEECFVANTCPDCMDNNFQDNLLTLLEEK